MTTLNVQDTMLVLRATNADLKSYNGFQWPESGPVSCEDWDSKPECGHGLHGLPWGEGHCGAIGACFDRNGDRTKWQVVKVDPALVVMLEDGQECKFPRGEVVFTGNLKGASDYLVANGGFGRAIWGAVMTVGPGRVATAGYRGTATAGYMGTATAGDNGTATAGDGGTAMAGYRGTATAGDSGTATAGEDGTATAGDGGTATAGANGTATAGDNGTIIIAEYDHNAARYRRKVGYIGEDGLLPKVQYKLENGAFVAQ